MKTKMLVSAVCVVLVLTVSWMFVGCGLIGFLVGIASDESKPDTLTVRSWEIQTLPPGSDVTVVLKSGDAFQGAYKGLVYGSAEEYADRFARNRLQWPPGVAIPSVNDNVTLTLKSGQEYDYKLIAYDYRSLLLRSAASPFAVQYQNIRTMSSKGKTLTSDSLQDLISKLDVPFYTAAAFETKTGTDSTFLNEIGQVKVKNSKHGAVTGLLVGLAVDVIVVAVIASSLRASSPRWSGTRSGSCPFVYSYDGEDYVLDSETFGGSIFKSLQRTDYDNLEHLSDRDGTCRLKIANELPETQYVDELKLLAVDHPEETLVIPSFSGQLHTISHPDIPTSAKDLENNDVLHLVNSTDDNWWISNPFGRHTDRALAVRDGLVLCFDRPRDAQSVKLALNLQNTPWATEVAGQLLRLQGSDLSRWYEAMNTTVKYREAFVEAVTREAMLSLSVCDGQSWSHAGYVWFVGPYVSKTQVVKLDIANVTGNELRIRLESTAGLWMVNSVEADFTPDVPLKVKEMTAATAFDQNGSDIREFLNAIDDRYYVLEKPGMTADVTFEAPAHTVGTRRTYVLKSTGYYTIHVPEEGTPQRSLVKKLGTEPGAFGSYSIRLLNNFVSARIDKLTSERKTR
jgi:hypothetical protein